MIDTGYILLGLVAVLPALVTAILFAIKQRQGDRISYWTTQIATGIIFGCIAIMGTECGIPLDGAVMNCRDAAVLCAGLFFGGPAGIIAGLIGGIERWFAVYWGVGAFTRVACSVSTILAGFVAAAARKHLLENRRPNWAFGFAIGAFMEAIHMLMCFITNLDNLNAAYEVVRVCTFPMVMFNAIGVMLAAALVALLQHEQPKRETTSVLTTFQNRLLLCIIAIFLATSWFSYIGQTDVSEEDTLQQLQITLYDAMDDFDERQAANDELDVALHRIGLTGYVLVVDPDGIIIAGPDDLKGRTPLSLGLPKNVVNLERRALHRGKDLPLEANVNGVDCFWTAASKNGYDFIAVFPATEAYETRDTGFILNTLSQILLFAVAFCLINLLIRRNIVNKVRQVNADLDDIAHDKMDTVVNVRSSYEFVQLSDGINATVDALKEHIAAEAARIDADLAMAKSIQLGMLPSVFPPFPDRPEFDIYARMDTAKEVGGDFYDFYLTKTTDVVFSVADVSGKGIPAAMFMMRAKTQLRSAIETRDSLEMSIARTNNLLCHENEAEMFVTTWTGLCHLDTGVLEYVNAGHNPPLIRLGDADSFDYLVSKANMVLGGIEGLPYRRHELQLTQGTQLFLYTDGVTEATNGDGELFGEERLKNVLNSAEFAARDLEGQCALVKEKIDEFVGDAPQFDDITMLTFIYAGRTEQAVEEIQVLATVDNIEQVTDFVNEKLEACDCPMKAQMQIDIAIDELFSNIAYYAYSPNVGPATVRVEVCKDPMAVIVTFVDNGVPYDPLAKEDPDITLSAQDRNIGGLGIYMVKQSMDEISYDYKNGQNILSIKKAF